MFNESLVNLKQEVSKNLKVNLSIDCRDSSSKIIRNLQHFLKLSPPNVQKSHLEMLLNYSLSAERACPGAGMKFLLAFSSDKILDEDVHVKKKNDIVKVISEQNFSKEVFVVLCETLDLISSKTRISLKKSQSHKIFIEVSEGYRFDAIRPIKVPDLELKNTKICCIDGYIESISEIHHLLTHLSESKHECLLLIRGASDDVLNTIKVNYDRRTLSLIPYIVPYDLESINTLVDIAVVSQTDVVSSTKGQVISSLDVSQLGTIESCYLTSSNLIIKNSKTLKRVKEHVSYLKEKLDSKEETQDLISKRITSLSSSCLDINIPDDIKFLSLSSQFDEGIRLLSSIVNKTYSPNKVANYYYNLWMNQISNCEQFLL